MLSEMRMPNKIKCDLTWFSLSPKGRTYNIFLLLSCAVPCVIAFNSKSRVTPLTKFINLRTENEIKCNVATVKRRSTEEIVSRELTWKSQIGNVNIQAFLEGVLGRGCIIMLFTVAFHYILLCSSTVYCIPSTFHSLQLIKGCCSVPFSKSTGKNQIVCFGL